MSVLITFCDMYMYELFIQITESFKGCMQNFTLNGNAIDLANSKRVMGVRPCFNNVERGVHFDGYGYATYGEPKNNYRYSYHAWL